MENAINYNLSQEMLNPEFRHAFFATRTQDETATQIRQLRKERGFTQSQLANNCEMKQSAISRIEDAEYSGWNFKTLLRVAKALDVRLKITFEPARDE